MKRRFLLIYILCISLLLSGCSGGGMYAEYQEIDLLLVIQAVGVDTAPGGGVRLSVSAGKLEDKPAVKMAAEGATISQAKNVLQDYAPNEELFYSHVSFVLIGEEAAKNGLGVYLDYIARSPELRINTPVFVVLGGTAEELVTKAGGEEHSIIDVLDSLKRDYDVRGSGHAFSATEIMKALGESDSAMVSCIKSTNEKAADSEAEEGALTALPAGYGILKTGKLMDVIPQGDARGINLLTGKVGSGTVDLDGDGFKAAAAIDSGGAKFTPVFGADGNLSRVDVDVGLKAGLIEAANMKTVGEDCIPALNHALAEMAHGWANAVISREKTLGIDFAGLGAKLELAAPGKYRAMPKTFEEQLPELDFNVTANANVGRSYDLSPYRAPNKEAK